MEEQYAVSAETRYAGFWIRFLAYVLDLIVIGGFTFLSYYAAGADLFSPPLGLDLATTVLAYVYLVVMTVCFGQTLGKMALGIRVIQADGEENRWGAILLRETIGKFVSGIILLIGYMMAGFDSKKRAMHDRMARTYVVKM
ncbi:RDD family protein [Brevibacillus formosus]|uniref:RDD family protein n=1 Tax=Brevibacillus formosus TaxID=54913 RepID=UPI003F1CC7EB